MAGRWKAKKGRPKLSSREGERWLVPDDPRAEPPSGRPAAASRAPVCPGESACSGRPAAFSRGRLPRPPFFSQKSTRQDEKAHYRKGKEAARSTTSLLPPRSFNFDQPACVARQPARLALDVPALGLLPLVLLATGLGLNLAVGDTCLPVDAVPDGVRPAGLGPEVLDLLALLDNPVVPLEPVCPG